jgi:hypothetical protein
MEDLAFLLLLIYAELTNNQVNCGTGNGRSIERNNKIPVISYYTPFSPYAGVK